MSDLITAVFLKKTFIHKVISKQNQLPDVYIDKNDALKIMSILDDMHDQFFRVSTQQMDQLDPIESLISANVYHYPTQDSLGLNGVELNRFMQLFVHFGGQLIES